MVRGCKDILGDFLAFYCGMLVGDGRDVVRLQGQWVCNPSGC